MSMAFLSIMGFEQKNYSVKSHKYIYDLLLHKSR